MSYEKLSRTALFRQGIDRVKQGAADYRVALMCAEREPMDCHRTLLVSKALATDGVAVSHILPDGALEAHGDTMLRILDFLGMPRNDLLLHRDQLIEEAYAARARQIAYRRT